MICLDSYKVPVIGLLLSKFYVDLSSAWLGNLPSNWDIAWSEIREKSDRDCQSIVKITWQGEYLGLIRFALYPYPGVPKFLEIEQLEASPISRGKLKTRIAKPIGMWLIWYAIKIALRYCNPTEEASFVILSAYEDALEYYRDKVKMEFVGCTMISPEEEGYAFRFSLSEAKNFCEQVEKKYGKPIKVEIPPVSN